MRKTFTQLSLIILCFSLSSNLLYAQVNISGKVSDENQKPVSYAVVQLESAKKGAQSDSGGNYTITGVTPGNYNIVISFLGYKNFSQAITVANVPITVDIALHTDAADLNEVVVIGYGTAKKSDLTGSVASLDAKDFNTGDLQSPEELIQGKVAGVVVTPGGGSPGSGAAVRIRGLASLSATNNPLYVIDGVPIDLDLSIPGSPNPLSLINPADIENITILKDASATAIYGSRASNGVIIVTTRRGTAGKFKVNFNSLNSIEMVSNTVNVLSPTQFRNIVDSFGTAAEKKLLGNSNTNWQNEVYRLALGTDDNLSFSGGIKNLPYRLSLEYSNQDGVLLTDNMQRGSVDLTATKTFFKQTLTITINEKGSITSNLFANEGSVGGAVSYDPTQGVYSTNPASPRYGGYFEWLGANGEPASLAPRNPVGLIEEKTDRSDVYRSIGNIQIDYKFPFFPDLHANLNTGYDVSEGTGTVNIPDSAASNYVNSYYNPKTADSIYKYARGSSSKYSQTNQNDVLDFTLNYKKDVKSIKSLFDATAGYSYANFLSWGPSYYTYYQNGDSIPGSKPAYPTYYENTLISFFGRFNYAFSDKYLLTATLRDDGSSRFAPDVRWGLFPSAALAWRICQESFLKNSKVLSDLKLRLGYGETGNQDIPGGDYPYQSQYYYSSETALYEFGNQFYPTLRPAAVDPDIKWESTATTNLALDYGFFGNRIFGSLDFYYKKTTNMIGTIFVPQGTNFSNEVTTNVGSMQNQGVEGSINVIPISKRDMTLEFDYNITYNENKVLSLSKSSVDTTEYLQGGISGGTGNTIQVIKAGYPAFSFLVYQQYYNDGHAVEGEYYYLIDGKPVVVGEGAAAHDSITKKPTAANLYVSSKSPFAKVTMGLSPSFRYKKWSIQMVLRGSIGNYMYNNVASGSTIDAILAAPTSLTNVSTDVLNTNFKTAQYLSDYYVQNASFVKIDNITLSYNVGKILKGKASLKLSATVQNVATFTPYKGLDPEIYGGIDNNIYPRPRIFSIGLNVQI